MNSQGEMFLPGGIQGFSLNGSVVTMRTIRTEIKGYKRIREAIAVLRHQILTFDDLDIKSDIGWSLLGGGRKDLLMFQIRYLEYILSIFDECLSFQITVIVSNIVDYLVQNFLIEIFNLGEMQDKKKNYEIGYSNPSDFLWIFI